MIVLAETRENVPETSFFYVSVNVFGPSYSRKYEFTHRKRVNSRRKQVFPQA